jgi:hypothetical protein
MLGPQWFTDCLDGALGRYRDTGIPKWGYYMDHFLDFVFMCIALNTAIIFFGTGFVQKVLPIALPLAGIALAVVVFRTQKYIWHIDMEDKRRRQPAHSS